MNILLINDAAILEGYTTLVSHFRTRTGEIEAFLESLSEQMDKSKSKDDTLKIRCEIQRTLNVYEELQGIGHIFSIQLNNLKSIKYVTDKRGDTSIQPESKA